MIQNDHVFDALGARQRRQLLVTLLGNRRYDVPALSDTSRSLLGGNESLLDAYLSSSREIPNSDKALLRTHHVHLPKLVEYEFVEWDRERDVVTRGPRFHELVPVLDVLVEQPEETRTNAPVVAVHRRNRTARRTRRSRSIADESSR